MLIFFIHGVATRNVKYADSLKTALKEGLSKQVEEKLNYYSSFWGNALNDIGRIWDSIDQDLQLIQSSDSEIDIKDYLRYRDFRREFLSEFVGDMFTYLNPQRGYAIRKKIAQDLFNFLEDNPQDRELYIVAHSLGTVILWDILFSDRFSEKDPALYIRALLQKSNLKNREIVLKGITTMGSPIIFFNTMLGVKSEMIKNFMGETSDHSFSLRWLNIIHRSDLLAYPLRSSIDHKSLENVQFKDIYIDRSNDTKALAARFARSIGQDMAAITLDAVDAHSQYWKCPRTAQFIIDHIQEKTNYEITEKKHLEEVTEYFQNVSGMIVNKLQFNIHDDPVERLRFKDGSGTLVYIINAVQIHHVYLFDERNICRFAGYVVWTHTDGLKAAIELVRNSWC